MTTPGATTTRRTPKKAPVPTAAPEPQWPAVDAAAATLRAMPEVAYLFTEKVPATKEPIVITRDKDAELHKASAIADKLPEVHARWLDEEFAAAHERVHGPTKDWCQPRHARPTDSAEEAAGSVPASSADQDEPDEAA